MPITGAPRKRRGVGRKKGGRRIARIARRVAKRVITQECEKKYWDTANTGAVSYSGTMIDISAIPQGDTDLTREGDRVNIKSIQGNFVWTNSASTSATTGATCRIILLQYLDSDVGGAPAVNTIIQSTGAGTSLAPLTPYAKDYAGYRFVPLWDSVVQVHSYSPVKHQHFKITSKDFRKKAKPHIQFASAGTTGNQKMYLLVISDYTADQPVLDYFVRVRFTDM